MYHPPPNAKLSSINQHTNIVHVCMLLHVSVYPQPEAYLQKWSYSGQYCKMKRTFIWWMKFQPALSQVICLLYIAGCFSINNKCSFLTVFAERNIFDIRRPDLCHELWVNLGFLSFSVCVFGDVLHWCCTHTISHSLQKLLWKKKK